MPLSTLLMKPAYARIIAVVKLDSMRHNPDGHKTGVRSDINMTAAVSGTSQMRYMTIVGCFNADVFIKFLKQIVSLGLKSLKRQRKKIPGFFKAE